METMTADPQCPKCNSENTYSDGNLWICPECAHEWSPQLTDAKDAVQADISNSADLRTGVHDAFGNQLLDGDSVTVIKELKVKGSSASVKVGTKVKKIRLVDGDDGHNISCKIDGIGSMNLKSEFVKKA